MFSNKIVNFERFKFFCVFLKKCKEWQKKVWDFQNYSCFQEYSAICIFYKVIFFTNLALEYNLKSLSWPLVGMTRVFEWLAARSRVFEVKISILQLIIFGIFSRLTKKGHLGAYQCVGPYMNWCASHALFYATNAI